MQGQKWFMINSLHNTFAQNQRFHLFKNIVLFTLHVSHKYKRMKLNPFEGF